MDQSQKIDTLMLLGAIGFGVVGAALKRKFLSDAKQEKDDDQQERNPERKQTFTMTAFQAFENKVQYNKLQFKDPENTLISELMNLENYSCEIEKIPNIICDLGLKNIETVVNPLLGDSSYRSVYGGEGFLPESAFVSRDCFIIQRADYGPNDLLHKTKRWLRGGPRKHLYFKENQVKAAIVSCGTLCPGINVLIRDIVMALTYNYKVKEVIGYRNGLRGVYLSDKILLTGESVKGIHHLGGNYLGTTPTKFEADLVIKELQKEGITQLYVIGGIGSMRMVYELQYQLQQQKLNIVVCGIPQSIENNIPVIDKSYGFDTAMEQCLKVIDSAFFENISGPQCLSIVKIAGKFAGFLAMMSSQASRNVNICLVPEFQFDFYGKDGLFEYLFKRLKIRGHCLLVVAEGAINAIRDFNNINENSDIAQLISHKFNDYAKKQGMTPEIRVFDPKYFIRACQPNSHDTRLCVQLAQYSIHGTMAGFTGFAAGHVSNKVCYIPLEHLLSGHFANRIQKHSIQWQRLLTSTGQPSFLNDESEYIEIA